MHLLIILSNKTLKLKSISNELWKGWKLAWYHHLTHIECARSREGYGKNWMHFVFKTDNLFRSIRVSDENSSVTRALHFFQTYLNSRLFLRSVHTIENHVINFQYFLTSFAIFQSFTDLFRELNDREIENHYIMNSEDVGTWHGIIISPA